METITRGQWQGHPGFLSHRELEFTLGVAAGKTDKEMAREAGLAPDSVRKRVYSAMYKLGVNRRAQLIADAMRRGIIAPIAIMLAICSVVNGGALDMERAPRGKVRITRNIRHQRRPELQFFDNPFDYV